MEGVLRVGATRNEALRQAQDKLTNSKVTVYILRLLFKEEQCKWSEGTLHHVPERNDDELIGICAEFT